MAINYPYRTWSDTVYYYGEAEYKLCTEAKLDSNTNFDDLSGTYKMNVQIEVSTDV